MIKQPVQILQINEDPHSYRVCTSLPMAISIIKHSLDPHSRIMRDVTVTKIHEYEHLPDISCACSYSSNPSPADIIYMESIKRSGEDSARYRAAVTDEAQKELAAARDRVGGQSRGWLPADILEQVERRDVLIGSETTIRLDISIGDTLLDIQDDEDPEFDSPSIYPTIDDSWARFDIIDQFSAILVYTIFKYRFITSNKKP